MDSRLAIGVDLGGTNVRAAVFAPDGSAVTSIVQQPSNAQSGVDAVVNAIANVVRESISGSPERPVAVGIAAPGHIDDDVGEVVWAPNFGQLVGNVFEYWQNVPLRSLLAPRLELPIRLGNDANLAALGEYVYGSGKNKAACLVMLTLGTGVGGGVILGPRSVVGSFGPPLMLVGGNQGGVELGHVCIQHNGLDCNAGTYGGIEAYAQRDSIVRRAIHRIQRGESTNMLDLAGGDMQSVTPKIIAEAANSGDPLALQVWSEVGEMLGVGVGSYINVFAPEVIAIGGQISKAAPYFMPAMLRSARNVAIPSLFEFARIGVAERDEDAGMLGAAALAILES